MTEIKSLKHFCYKLEWFSIILRLNLILGCEPPAQLPMTVVYGNMFSIGASVKYECTDGYKLILVNVCMKDLVCFLCNEKFQNSLHKSELITRLPNTQKLVFSQ